MDKSKWCLVNIGLIQRQIVDIGKRQDLGQKERQAILTRLSSELKGYEIDLIVALTKEQYDKQ